MTKSAVRVDNIQGNIFGGFNKDFQTLLFLRFRSGPAGRAWIGAVSAPDFDEGVAHSNSARVMAFNGRFKALRAAGLNPEEYLEVAWTNLAISFQGLRALGVKATDLTVFPADYRDGMALRKNKIGDVGSSDPATWIAPFRTPADLHAVLIIAADNEDLLKKRVHDIKTMPTFMNGVDVLGDLVEGRTRLDHQAGHEHFGFKDGVSQPGIRGVTPPDDPIGNPSQGQPGQDLLWPGEFVLGYPTQKPCAKSGGDGPNPDPGKESASGPSWTRDGSYFVFRRLAQDVPAFQAHVEALAAANGLDPDLMGAKLVGRYKSGCPVETRNFEKPHDPPPKDPAGIDAHGHPTPGSRPVLADSDSLNNDFEFGDDKNGGICPLASHVRKAYPRNEQTLPNNDDSESDTQTHRLLRRGIPFGGSIGDPVGGGAGDPRGLLFMCYQKSIEKQFEFVQSSWVNNAEFPLFPDKRPTPGEDPIIAQSPEGSFTLDPAKPALMVKHFVTTTGGEYFFAPSIRALQELGAGLHGSPVKAS